MATQTENLTATTTVVDNPSKTLDTKIPVSTKPDRVERATTTASSTADTGTDGAKKDGEDSNRSTATAVNSLSGNGSASVSNTEKKIRRAERFGITVQLSEEEKRNSRAERFGTGSTSHGSDSLKKSEELKRKARAERFGLPVATDEDAKKKARLERFAPAAKTDALEEDKRKARAIRFSQPPTSSLSMNGKGDIEPVLQARLVEGPEEGFPSHIVRFSVLTCGSLIGFYIRLLLSNIRNPDAVLFVPGWLTLYEALDKNFVSLT